MGLIRGWEDPLENVVAIHSSILAWEISWTRNLVAIILEVTRVGHDLVTKNKWVLLVYFVLSGPNIFLESVLNCLDPIQNEVVELNGLDQ